MAKTNPIPAGTKNVSINMPIPLRDALKKLAYRSGKMPLGEYCRRVLVEAADRDVVIDSVTSYMTLREDSVVFSSKKAAKASQANNDVVKDAIEKVAQKLTKP